MNPRAWPGLILTAALVLGVASVRGDGHASSLPAPALIQDPTPVACTKDRDTETETIGPDGGEIDAKYAQVVFPHGAYAVATEVTMTPEPAYHGITLAPPPKVPVLVLLRANYCGGKEASRYWLETATGRLSAVQMDLGQFIERKWAGAMVDPEAFHPAEAPGQGLLQRSGFVILSN